MTESPARPIPSPVVVIGLGQLGTVWSQGFLRAGHPVVPVLRTTSLEAVHARYPEPELVLVAVAEEDLTPVLDQLPSAWRSRVGLVQNELLPTTWQAQRIDEPTVAVVWFEKKPGRPVHNVLPTALAGPHAELLAKALDALEIPWRTVKGDELTHELVAKNLYILTLNLAGLHVEGTAGDLLSVHRELLDALASETLELQRALLGRDGASLEPQRLLEALETAIASDPGHGSAGRSAPRRLARNLRLARQLGLELPTWERLGREHLPPPTP